MSAKKKPNPNLIPPVGLSPNILGHFIAQGVNSSQPNHGENLSPEKELLLRIRVTSENDRELLKLANPTRLGELQDNIVSKVNEHLGSKALARVEFYRGSLIIIVTITAGVLISVNRNQLSYLANDIRNVVSRVFQGVKELASKIDYNIVKKGLSIIGDLLSVGSKLFQVFGGGLPTCPSLPDGWEPI